MLEPCFYWNCTVRTTDSACASAGALGNEVKRELTLFMYVIRNHGVPPDGKPWLFHPKVTVE